MKRLLMLSAATLCAGLLLTGCTAFINKTEVTTEEKVTTLKPVQTPEQRCLTPWRERAFWVW